VYFGRSRSRFQRTRMSLNSNVAVNRPHMSGKSSAGLADGQGRFSIPLLKVSTRTDALFVSSVLALVTQEKFSPPASS
jgi:hypothetical protein